MGPFLAWLPFLVALVLAFSAGIVFSRINDGLAAAGGPGVQARRNGLSRLYRADVVLTTVLVLLLVAVVLVWLVAVVDLIHGRVL
jgi:hypothetical protein